MLAQQPSTEVPTSPSVGRVGLCSPQPPACSGIPRDPRPRLEGERRRALPEAPWDTGQDAGAQELGEQSVGAGVGGEEGEESRLQPPLAIEGRKRAGLFLQEAKSYVCRAKNTPSC